MLIADVGRQRGFSLLEALVAIVVLSIALLGLAALQGLSLKQNANANVRTQAAIAIYDIMDRMRANAANAAAYVIDMADGPPTSPQTVADSDLNQWLNGLATGLPGGDGSIAVTGNIVTITVQWIERAASAGEASSYLLRIDSRL